MTKDEILAEAKKALAMLPVSYYLKTSIDVSLDEKADTSYFNPDDWKIVVSLNNIGDNASRSNPASSEDIEKIVRCLLYHEVSHAIMTPKDLMQQALSFARYGEPLNPKIANIIEDERIETILGHYYHGVDFKWNIAQISPLNKLSSLIFEGFVFNAVRHRWSPIDGKAINDRVNEFIRNSKAISACWPKYGNAYLLATKMNELAEFLKEEWEKFVGALPKPPSKSMPSASSGEDEDGNGGKGQNGEGQSASGSKNQPQGQPEEGDQIDGKPSSVSHGEECDSSPGRHGESEDGSTENGKGESSSQEEEKSQEEWEREVEAKVSAIEGEKGEAEDVGEAEATERIGKAMAAASAESSGSRYSRHKMRLGELFPNRKALVKMLAIIERNAGFGNAKSQAMNGYSGRFSPKAFQKDWNGTGKWFKRKTEEETGISAKKAEKKVLNIWLDNSSSYVDNDLETNGVLAALAAIERKNDTFSFNLVRITTHFTLLKGDDRVSLSRGDNDLPKEEIVPIYRKLNPTGREFNLVLFDGLCCTPNYDAFYDALNAGLSRPEAVVRGLAVKMSDSMAQFDNNRTVIITEKSNAEGFRRALPHIRELIEENSDYPNRLAENIVRALNLLF